MTTQKEPIRLPEITDDERATAVVCAVQRELISGQGMTLTSASWKEIEDKTLADLLAANTDALVDDVFEFDETWTEDDITGILTVIKAGSEMLGADYLSRCLTHLKGRWVR